MVAPAAPHKKGEPPVIADGAVVFTITALVAIGALLPQADVAVKEYTPADAVLVVNAEGFCRVDVKLLGPAHAKVPPAAPVAAPVRVSVEPLHTGLGVAVMDTAVGALQ
jgi:hypothetical protein